MLSRFILIFDNKYIFLDILSNWDATQLTINLLTKFNIREYRFLDTSFINLSESAVLLSRIDNKYINYKQWNELWFQMSNVGKICSNWWSKRFFIQQLKIHSHIRRFW